MNNNMDVDTGSLPSGVKRSSSMSSSSINKRTKLELDWSPTQRKTLNEKMMAVSSRRYWENRVEEAGSSDPEWRILLSEILGPLTNALQATDRSDIIISPLNEREADGTVDGFNNEVFEEWKLGVRKGVKGEWDDLIEHRMHYFALGPLGVAGGVKQPFSDVPSPRLPWIPST